MLQHVDNWGGLTAENKKFMDAAYEAYVPWSGHANTLGGEIVRAINRIVYKFYNDGDTVQHYYSAAYNHSWACDSFLENHVPNYNTLRHEASDIEFEKKLSKNFNHIAEYLRNNPVLFQVPNSFDCLDNAP
jgi:hypothetical protein